MKATNVDGIYTADPKTDPKATKYETITFQEVLEQNLKVMDAAAIALCRENRLPILVLSFRDEEAYAPLALQAGARGYLMKGVDGDTLVKGIRKALNGQMVLSPFMRRRLGRHGH